MSHWHVREAVPQMERLWGEHQKWMQTFQLNLAKKIEWEYICNSWNKILESISYYWPTYLSSVTCPHSNLASRIKLTQWWCTFIDPYCVEFTLCGCTLDYHHNLMFVNRLKLAQYIQIQKKQQFANQILYLKTVFKTQNVFPCKITV